MQPSSKRKKCPTFPDLNLCLNLKNYSRPLSCTKSLRAELLMNFEKSIFWAEGTSLGTAVEEYLQNFYGNSEKPIRVRSTPLRSAWKSLDAFQMSLLHLLLPRLHKLYPFRISLIHTPSSWHALLCIIWTFDTYTVAMGDVLIRSTNRGNIKSCVRGCHASSIASKCFLLSHWRESSFSPLIKQSWPSLSLGAHNLLGWACFSILCSSM